MNPHCEWHIYDYAGKKYLVPWGEDHDNDPIYEIRGKKLLEIDEDEAQDVTDYTQGLGTVLRVLQCVEFPFARDCSWDDLPEEYAVDNGWTIEDKEE